MIPTKINLTLFDFLSVLITNIEAREVIMKKKNGIDNIECKLWLRKILL